MHTRHRYLRCRSVVVGSVFRSFDSLYSSCSLGVAKDSEFCHLLQPQIKPSNLQPSTTQHNATSTNRDRKRNHEEISLSCSVKCGESFKPWSMATGLVIVEKEAFASGNLHHPDCSLLTRQSAHQGFKSGFSGTASWKQPSASPRSSAAWFTDTCKQKPILFSIPTTTAHLRALPLVRKRIFRSTNKERNPPQRRVLALNRLEPDPMVTARLLPPCPIPTKKAMQMSNDKRLCAGTNTVGVTTC